jgi:hypothetical protein
MSAYRDFQPNSTSRVRESIEWSIRYSFRTEAKDLPRVLLIGDSICNAYHGAVAARLGDDAVITYWASSKCVTDPEYFRELDFILDSADFTAITFNNGMHSLTTDLAEWEEAYRAAVKFIRAKKPAAQLLIVFTTPHGTDSSNDRVNELNAIAADIAEKETLPVIDLYSKMMDLGREHLNDVCHWKGEGVNLQAQIIAEELKRYI